MHEYPLTKEQRQALIALLDRFEPDYPLDKILDNTARANASNLRYYFRYHNSEEEPGIRLAPGGWTAADMGFPGEWDNLLRLIVDEER